MKMVIIPLAEGFEEIEAVTSIDILRRAGIEVITVGLDTDVVKGAHKLKIETDKRLKDVLNYYFDAVVLPGGMPGAANLRESSELLNLIKNINAKKGLIAAICAAPIVLEAAGVLKDREATSYPGYDSEMESANYSEERVVVDRNLITARGAGAAAEFALEIVKYLVGEDEAFSLKEAMFIE
ncbi:DJ-1 family glyoxalase III [Halanaerobium sp. MA284_MarDTE_T2]|uniref:DJ-1 family glyoxalase III n=1 Tax=Halanaerobium sp. MA284_MarDTE_T2 TaxID=2183913 RepID=UPI000DF43EFF|nr:DJ-1 family glyoxalase III [Halanaerobium sp. MA284_MarDTE_T2]RCW49849.1 4-methyl-5(b-hydroxyethyl)-thiazole monophosphate biosynthesis [Halanaerobium sp. MA284_MarDTE_T2]